MLYILNFYLDKTKLLFSFVKKQLEVEVCALQSWGYMFLAAKKVEEGNVVIFLTYLLCTVANIKIAILHFLLVPQQHPFGFFCEVY